MGRWCNLNRLVLISLPFNSFYGEVDFGRLPTQDLSDKGLQLRSLDLLATSCPLLEELAISINAGPTDHLAELHNGFRKLKCLTFEQSFLNYAYPTFNHRDALLYITSLFNDTPSCAVFFGPNPLDIGEIQPDQIVGLNHVDAIGAFYKTMSRELGVAFATRTDTVRRIAAHGLPSNLNI